MYRTLRGRWVLVGLGVALAVAAAVAQAATAKGTFERTLTVTGPVDLAVLTGSGHINVRAVEGNQVRIRGLVEARSGWWGNNSLDPEEKVRRIVSSPPITQTGNSIHIGRIEEKELQENVSVSYEIEVPANTRFKGETGSGHQTIEGLKGPVQTSTGSGHLKIFRIDSGVEAKTGSGHIELADIRGDVRAETGSGHITATGVAGNFRGDTGSGSVELQLAVPAEADIETGSGSVEVTGARGGLRISTGSGSIEIEGQPTEDWKLETGSGGISIRLPAEAAFELDAHSDSGRVHTSHPVTVVGTQKPNALRGTVRGGGPRLSLETGSGTITIH
ncbi:MAG TPA: DUF4097 family beta strand repeat-containing protein [Candidatus Xenobia bacterium]|nr:DUF4097 family beta strand repeat-containing protein [Candidatus Xenobia bacterium]